MTVRSPAAPDHVATSPVDDAVFRNVVGHFATGVTVITTTGGGSLYGTTASAVSSLSMDPPMMLICLNRSSSTHDAVQRSGVYGINILTSTQGDLARHFARKGEDKFAQVEHVSGARGVPILPDALAAIVCEVVETTVGGTHTIFLGRVVTADAQAGEPLAYYRGGFGRLQPDQQSAAYELTRDWVLRRRTPLDTPLDAQEIADRLSLAPEHVHAALISLTAESLVLREDDGRLFPTPITPAFVDSLYDARMAIEVGVLETCLRSITPADLAALRAISDDIARASSVRRTDDLDAFLALNYDFHARLIAIVGSPQLSEAYRRLHVTTVWRETFDADDWAAQLGGGRVSRVMEAISTGDARAAQEALREHTETLRAGAKQVVEVHGGRV